MPRHVAIIMDGNGRWAGERRLQRFFGHTQGAETVQYVVETASRIDLPWLTLYAFSIENNLRRPREEVGFLMKLLNLYLVKNVKRMNDNNVRIAYIGRIDELPGDVQEAHAQLISAAPQLIEALEYFFNIMHDYESSLRKGYVKHAMDMARAALTSAKGGAI